MFKFLGGLLGNLFGGSESANKTMDFVSETARGVGTWIDERKFTEEEQSKANFENLQVVLEGVRLTRDENTARSITRRVLAWSIMGSFLLSFWIALIFNFFNKDITKDIMSLTDAYMLPELAIAVGSFYFLVSITRSMKKG